MISDQIKQDSFKYDIAFSFLARDEALATEINDLLQDRFKTFLYSRRQGEIAGTDGEKTFNRVFSEESRIVVILYRLEWGKTPWTRIEETAIRNRAFEHGYDFTIFIPLEDSPNLPKWVPKTKLWIGLKKYGANGAAIAIEMRVQEQGGEPHEETVTERAARLSREYKFAEYRVQFCNSFDGVEAANKEFEFLNEELQRLVTEIKDCVNIDIKRHIKPRAAEKLIVILSFGLGLRLIWKCPSTNILDAAELVIEFWDGHPPFPGTNIWSDFETGKLKSIKFKFDLSPYETYIWIQPTSKRQYGTGALANFILKEFMDEIQRRNISKK